MIVIAHVCIVSAAREARSEIWIESHAEGTLTGLTIDAPPALYVTELGLVRRDGTKETLVALLATAEGGIGPGWELGLGDVVRLGIFNGSTALATVDWSLRIEQQCMLHEDCRMAYKLGKACLKRRSRKQT